MSRSVNLPPFRSWLPDNKPLRIHLSFTNNMKEEHPMSKEEFVIHCIRHAENYPDLDEIDLDTARSVIDNLAPDASLPAITAEEFMALWNASIHDPDVMSLS